MRRQGAYKIAGTNRNPKLGQNAAWMHYWSAFFPSGVGWRTDLECEIRKRLYLPREISGLQVGKKPKLEPLTWANNLEIGFHDNLVVTNFQNLGFGTNSNFHEFPHFVMSTWSDKKSLEGSGSLPDLTARDRERYRDFPIAAIRDCGHRPPKSHTLHSQRDRAAQIQNLLSATLGDLCSNDK